MTCGFKVHLFKESKILNIRIVVNKFINCQNIFRLRLKIF